MHSERQSSVALTFDDGPDPIWTPLVLDALAETGARATFFVIAPRASSYPHLISRMRDEGHAVAFHCVEHVRHDARTRREIEHDTRTGLLALGDLGRTPRYWRTPWGLVTPASEDTAREFGLTLVGWTTDTKDWRGDAHEEMLASVEAGFLPGAIVMMHDGIGPGATREGCAETVALVKPLVALARSRGLEPVTIGEIRHPLPARNPDFQTRTPDTEGLRRV
ncbi:MAG TPA: polysaccharide deacetylase family protein [Rubrobacter sp.]|nr:polysaccharide deacetylase family protein [Rubrobacter sp.]